MSALAADLCVIGGGAGGLAVAAAAAELGAKVVLADADARHGQAADAPPAALLAAGQAAWSMRRAGRLGIPQHEPAVDLARVGGHVRGVDATSAARRAIERFSALGCTVLPARARFVAPDTAAVDGMRVTARRFVIATGSRPKLPDIPGLAALPPLTTDSLFGADGSGRHLLVVGAGPNGCETAQAYRRLGVDVTLIDDGAMLADRDPELTAVVKSSLMGDGVTIVENATIERVDPDRNGVAIAVAERGRRRRIAGSHLMVATGRRPDIDDLGLATAGIAATEHGIAVDARLRTTNRRVFALGDATGGESIAAMAAQQACVVIRNALFRIPSRLRTRAVPTVVYTDPELAQVGLTESEAAARGVRHRILRLPFAENDRARTERRVAGQIKAIVSPWGRILGASIVGAHASELLQPWILAIDRGLGIGALANVIAPYPTRSEASRRVAAEFFAPALFGTTARRVVRLLARLG